MAEANKFKALKERHRIWAMNLGIDLDRDGYCTTLEQNLFLPLSNAARGEFAGGDGSEFGKARTRGKILALHSSAALACNFFDYWRERDLAGLAAAFGLSESPYRLAFEQKFPTGLGGIAPNIDVVLYLPDGAIFAIESKFTEPYATSKKKCYLKPKYFLDGRHLWAEVGLPGCQAVADDIRKEQVQFEFLDVSQMLKHMLGLARGTSTWRLCCLWYRIDRDIGEQHANELADFCRRLGPDSCRFDSQTYQDLFARITNSISPEHDSWVSYMRQRYFEAD
jgi:hypothetical protein